MDFKQRAEQAAKKCREEEDKKGTAGFKVKMPPCPVRERSVPNAVIRSALFGCSQRRVLVKDKELVSYKDTTVLFRGETLNQYDETVWLQLIHLYREQKQPEWILFSGRSFCRSLTNRGVISGQEIKRLHESLDRLMFAVVRVRQKSRHRWTYRADHLLYRFRADLFKDHLAVTLSSEMLELLDVGSTRLDWETRLVLPTGLATWMQRFVQSHQATAKHPSQIGLEKLRDLTGMTSSTKEFKRCLKNAMILLEVENIVEAWEVGAKTLHFSRPRR